MIDLRPWWQAADPVTPGYWLVRARLGQRKWGPLVPAAIMRVQTTEEPGTDNKMDRPSFWAAFVGGEPVSIWTLQQSTHTFHERIYRREQTIDRAEYEFRCADLQWASTYTPDDPAAQPNLPFSLTSAPPIYQRRK